MHAWGLALAVASIGCGRISFETTTGASGDDSGGNRVCATPVGHDEDGDGIDDACDGCPHVADASQPDRDGDGVDDACDPEPTNPRQSIAFFDPMTGPRVDVEQFGTPSHFVYANDDLIMDATNELDFLAMVDNVDADVLEWSVNVELTGPLNHQMTVIGVHEASQAIVYCELNEDTNGLHWQITYTYDSGTFSFIDPTDLPGAWSDRNVVMRMSRVGSMTTCESTYPGATQRAGSTPADIPGETWRLSLSSVRGSIHYVVKIHTTL